MRNLLMKLLLKDSGDWRRCSLNVFVMHHHPQLVLQNGLLTVCINFRDQRSGSVPPALWSSRFLLFLNKNGSICNNSRSNIRDNFFLVPRQLQSLALPEHFPSYSTTLLWTQYHHHRSSLLFLVFVCIFIFPCLGFVPLLGVGPFHFIHAASAYYSAMYFYSVTSNKKLKHTDSYKMLTTSV